MCVSNIKKFSRLFFISFSLKDDETPEYQQLLQGKLDEPFLLDVDNYEYYRTIKFKLEAATRRSDALFELC